MSDETKTESTTLPEEIFQAAYFAALTGLCARAAGQDPGSLVNEAYKIALYSKERFETGGAVMTENERELAMKAAAAEALARLPGGISAISAQNPGVTVMHGSPFQRPVAP